MSSMMDDGVPRKEGGACGGLHCTFADGSWNGVEFLESDIASPADALASSDDRVENSSAQI